MVSNSFTVAEIEMLDATFRTLMRGGDVRQLARSPALKTIAVKTAKMVARLKAQKAAAAQ